MKRNVNDKTSYKNLSWKERREKRFREGLKKPIKTQIHPWNIISYLIQLAIVIVVYDFLRNHFMMLVLYLVAAAPVLDIVGLIFLHRALKIELTAPERDVSRFSVGYLNLKLVNPSILVSFDVNVKLDVESAFYGDESGAIISLPCSARSEYEKQIPIKYSMNGIYKYAIKAFTVRDLLGFVSLKKKADALAEVNVFPEKDLATGFDMSDMNRGMTESEESAKKGHDFSDVSDVREYIPGDKLMSIHWKLSAKRDILMVKDRVSMSDQQMVILIELSGRDEAVDEVITLAYAVIKRLVQEQTYVKMLWWSEGRFSFEERQIMNLENLKTAFGDMYYESIYFDPEKTKGYMQSIYPELKAYLNATIQNDRAEIVVVEQD